MERKVTEYFIQWKDRLSRKPLVITGARQIGKSFSVQQFGEKYFEQIITVNFEQRPEMKRIFSNFQPERIIMELSILLNRKIEAGNTLLFFDEIQACPEAFIALRYFYEDIPQLHVIAAGSLLEHTLSEMKYQMPVGRIEFCNMFPLSFEEFMIAGNEKLLVDYLKSWQPEQTFSEPIHQKALNLLKLYYLVGGMPEAVASFFGSSDVFEVERIQSSILKSFQFDFAKYGTQTQLAHLQTVFNYLSINSCTKLKYSNIDKLARADALREALYKLEKSKVVHRIRHTTASRIPLKAAINDDTFKTLFVDIGLTNRAGGIKIMQIQEILSKHKGMLAEQFIGQEILNLSEFYEDTLLYYWIRENKSANSEVDYLLQHNNKVFPIEVKAGMSGSLKSLQVFLAERNLTQAIRFNLDIPSVGNFTHQVLVGKELKRVNFSLLSLPLYLCFRLKELINLSFQEN